MTTAQQDPLLAAAREEVRLDLTPLIDCVFLILVFFICIDFRALEAKLPADLPLDRGSAIGTAPPRFVLTVRIVSVQDGQRVYPRGGPERLDPVTQRPFRFVLVGHQVQWQIGPRRAATKAALLTELQNLHRDQSLWVPDPDRPGQKMPPAVAIAPGPGTCADDVAATTDAARAAGFTAIEFAGAPAARGPGR